MVTKYQERKSSNSTKHIEDEELEAQYVPKGKNRDFVWVTLWDLPLNYSKYEVRRLLKKFGSADEIRMRKLNYYQIAEVKLFMNNSEQEERIKANWAIGLEDGKLARLTIGNYNIENLKKRENFRAILGNIPSTAQETLLLRALQITGAKSVYIPYNSNRNPSRIAKVFFKSKEDLEKAVNRSIYYFNTKLYWKENIVYDKEVNRRMFSQERGTRSTERKSLRREKGSGEWTRNYRFEEEESRNYEKNKKQNDSKKNFSYENRVYMQNSASKIDHNKEEKTILEKILEKLEGLESKQVNPAPRS
jgi:hypothetical protein